MSLKHLEDVTQKPANKHVDSFRTWLRGFPFTATAFSQLFLLIQVDRDVFLVNTYHFLKRGYGKGLEWPSCHEQVTRAGPIAPTGPLFKLGCSRTDLASSGMLSSVLLFCISHTSGSLIYLFWRYFPSLLLGPCTPLPPQWRTSTFRFTLLLTDFLQQIWAHFVQTLDLFLQNENHHKPPGYLQLSTSQKGKLTDFLFPGSVEPNISILVAVPRQPNADACRRGLWGQDKLCLSLMGLMAPPVNSQWAGYPCFLWRNPNLS